MRMLIAATLACTLPLAAQAQQGPGIAPVAASSQPADSAHLALAQRVAGRLLPPGAFTTMMRATMDKISGGMVDQMMSHMPLGEIAKMAGADPAKAASLDAVNLKQVMEIVDPGYAERMRITMKVMGDEMVVVMTDLEPEYRAGLADALAARFTPAQLQELDRFFATPVGSAYAGQSMTLYVDPAMMRRMDVVMPRVMQAMPGIMQKVMAATAHLPRPGDFKTLTDEQKARLAALLGAGDAK